jgi:crotonobetainyl-CoA:carnitine CoA-transferase CaiB-like acyl-CoA transferase
MFEGVRVLELAQWVFVPATGAVLADLGADVIKIENPRTGDPYRGLTTMGIAAMVGGVNLNWEQNNRGKKSLAVDIRTDEGREIVYDLVADTDVFLTNFLPRTLARLGFMLAGMASAFAAARRTPRRTTAPPTGREAGSRTP